MLTRLYSPRKNREDGFTLIELLIVVIIIGILAAIALPIFLNQQKAAADASVQSDVRNTVDSVATWQIANQGTAATSASAYTTAGGKLTVSGYNTVGVSIGTDGSYAVCGYSSRGARFTSASAAYTYTTATGTFGLGTCATGSDTGGASTQTAVAPTITTTGTTLPAAQIGSPYGTTSPVVAATGNPTPTFSATGLPTGLSMSTTGVISGTPAASNSAGTFTVAVTATNGTSPDATKSFTMTLQAFQQVVSTAPTTGFVTLTNGAPTVTTSNGQTDVYTGGGATYIGLKYTFSNIAQGHSYKVTTYGGCYNPNGIQIIADGNTFSGTPAGVDQNNWQTTNTPSFVASGTTMTVAFQDPSYGSYTRCDLNSMSITQLN